MKCDESRPVCNRCVRARRECKGYPDLVSYRLQVSDTSNSISTYNIPFKIPGSQVDRQLLHYYCSQVAFRLGTSSDRGLWTELILQRCHHQPVIRYALVALSSLHRDFQSGGGPSPLHGRGNGQPWTASTASLMMIAKSHRQLARYLSRPDASADVALICSVIYFICESLLGDAKQAIWHIDRGLVLLKRSQLSKAFDANFSNDPLVPRLTALFERLDCQACTFDDQRAPVLVLSSPPELRGAVPTVPDRILDLDHAESVLVKLQNRVFHHLVASILFKGKPVEELPQSLIQERFFVVSDLEKYGSLLGIFADDAGFAIDESPLPPGELDENTRQRWKQYLVLRINFHSFHHLMKDYAAKFARLSSSTQSVQTATLKSELEEDLDIAIDAVSSILLICDSPVTKPQRTYTLSSHMIAILYFVGAKTTSPITRQKTVELLSHPSLSNSRDGLWDAQTASSSLNKLMNRLRKRVATAASVPLVKEGTNVESLSQGRKELPIARCQGWSINLASSRLSSRKPNSSIPRETLMVVSRYQDSCAGGMTYPTSQRRDI